MALFHLLINGTMWAPEFGICSWTYQNGQVLGFVEAAICSHSTERRMCESPNFSLGMTLSYGP
jgi:hypothetical protein